MILINIYDNIELKELIGVKVMIRLVVIGKNKKITATVFLVLRVLVIITMILQFLKGNYENVFMCLLTLILFAIPIIIDQKLNIKLPNTLEIIIFLFIFSAEILGEVQNFYGVFKHWDTILHTLNGFLCAAIGFSMIDILNRKGYPKPNLTSEEIMDEVVKTCAKVEPDCRILRYEIAYDKESEKTAGAYTGYCSAVCSTSGIGTRWYLRTDYTASPDFYYLSCAVSSDWL